MRLLLLGCSGFIGRELVPWLLDQGHELTLVSRRSQPFPDLADRLVCLELDPAQPASWRHPELLAALAAAGGVINLAGEPIAERRWSEAQRQILRSSRLSTTASLVAAMAALPQPPSVLVNASAVGFYGTSEAERFRESGDAGDDFLAALCRDWEQQAQAAPAACRVVILRIGIVLGPDGGAMGRMLPVFRTGFGGPIGSGQQWMSWIHRHDLCRLVAMALEDSSYTGVINAVAHEPVRTVDFASALGAALRRPSLLPVPGPVLQLLLGDGAKVVLEGQQVVSERLSDLGFEFEFGDLKAALAAATSSESR
ncbi:epimerase [Cyanobium sp.]|nr:epimerase [Cyanobium sp.]